MEIDVITQTPDYLILNKSAGLMVHGDGVSMDPTLVDWLLEHYPEIDGVGEDWHTEKKGDKEEMIIKRPGIVHRLDRDTSGVMIVARTQEFFDFMKKQFQEHLVQKSYRAYVYGHMKHDHGVIDAPIGRSRTDIRQWSATRGARGNMRDAVTEYTVLARGYDEAGEKYSYVEFRPKTGRTHQIRVHAKYMNHPIVGDALYAGKLIERGNLGFQRQALHALSLSFIDTQGIHQIYECPVPPDFQKACAVFMIQ